MSLNKVLNRPMFRQKALKKGDLKPVYAQMGTMVGSPGPTITGVVNPNRLPSTVVKPQGFFQKLGSEFRTSRQGIQQIMNPKSPQFTAKGTFGSGRLLPGLLGVEGVYSVVDPVVGQYMKPGIARDLVSYGISGAATLNPYVRAAGLAKFGYDTLDKYAFKPLAAGVKAYRSTPVSERKVLPDISGEASIDNFPQPATNEEIKEEVKVTSKAKPGSSRPGFSDRLTEQDNESDVVKGNVDINKVVKNNDPNQSPVTIGAEDTVAEKGFKEKPKTDTGTKVETDDKANLNVAKADTNDLDKPGKIKAADGTEVDNEVITLARQYRKELMAGQKSQAKLVFLANLASGLLSGTTTKGGIGGALEVFGKALGPAVNNYATVKLKENELSNEFMSDALELASDEIDRANEIIEAPPIEGDPGMIQFTDSNGNLVNMRGIQAKDGTVMVAQPGQLNKFGRYNYVPLAPGQFNRFVKSSELDPKALDTLMELDQKYKAYQYGQKSVALIEKFVEQGKTGAGPIGRFNLFKGRVSEALFDLTGRKMFTNEDEAREKASEYRDLLIDDWLKSNDVKGKNDEEKRQNAGAAIDKILGDSVNKDKIMSAIGEFTGEADQQALSQLAINETVMVYALANSLKSKDRLTAKDIQMAKDLVNIFPLLRGQKAVIRDLKSVNATILQDISSLENTYTTALMGETETLKQYKQKYGLATSKDFMAPQALQPLFEDKSTNELLEMF